MQAGAGSISSETLKIRLDRTIVLQHMRFLLSSRKGEKIEDLLEVPARQRVPTGRQAPRTDGDREILHAGGSGGDCDDPDGDVAA